jgi:hypothetical protein
LIALAMLGYSAWVRQKSADAAHAVFFIVIQLLKKITMQKSKDIRVRRELVQPPARERAGRSPGWHDLICYRT